MSMKNDFVMPITVLLFICLFVSGALAVVNSVTNPIIEEAARIRAAEARKEIMPQANEFEQLELESLRSQSNLPRTINEIHRAANNTGYIVMVTVIGYGGPIRILCGIDMDGRVIRTAILDHNETQGLGTPIFEEPHAGQYWGRDRSGIEEITVISGATITSVALKNAVRDALIAFEIAARSRGAR